MCWGINWSQVDRYFEEINEKEDKQNSEEKTDGADKKDVEKTKDNIELTNSQRDSD